MRLSELIDKMGNVTLIGDASRNVTGIIPLESDQHNESTLTWTKNLDAPSVEGLDNTTLICPADGSSERIENLKKRQVNLIITENPRLTFLKTLQQFDTSRTLTGRESTAVISPGVQIGVDCYIGHNVVIENNVTIGDKVIILHNTVIKSNTRIGDDVKIGCNNTIGGVGFGYELSENSEYELIPHIGGVLIEDHVEVGNNTCIDRAVLGNTILHENVKVDNLVHIAHGVDIGRNSLIIANSMIAGSVKIGQDCWVAPSSSVLNKLQIGENSLTGMGSVVIRDVENNEIVAGNPAKVLKRKDK